MNQKLCVDYPTPVGTASGETFASYIENAFKKELIVARMYDPNTQIELSLQMYDLSLWKYCIG